MAIEILMPALSPTMEEGTLAKWLVKEGDTVSSGDIMAEIETDKATMEFEAVDEGTIGKILIDAGTEGVKVNTPIAVLLEEGEDASDIDSASSAAPAEQTKADDSDDAKSDKAPAAAKPDAEAPKAPETDTTPDWPEGTKLKQQTVREALRDAMAEEMRRDLRLHRVGHALPFGGLLLGGAGDHGLDLVDQAGGGTVALGQRQQPVEIGMGIVARGAEADQCVIAPAAQVGGAFLARQLGGLARLHRADIGHRQRAFQGIQPGKGGAVALGGGAMGQLIGEAGIEVIQCLQRHGDGDGVVVLQKRAQDLQRGVGVARRADAGEEGARDAQPVGRLQRDLAALGLAGQRLDLGPGDTGDLGRVAGRDRGVQGRDEEAEILEHLLGQQHRFGRREGQGKAPRLGGEPGQRGGQLANELLGRSGVTGHALFGRHGRGGGDRVGRDRGRWVRCDRCGRRRGRPAAAHQLGVQHLAQGFGIGDEGRQHRREIGPGPLVVDLVFGMAQIGHGFGVAARHVDREIRQVDRAADLGQTFGDGLEIDAGFGTGDDLFDLHLHPVQHEAVQPHLRQFHPVDLGQAAGAHLQPDDVDIGRAVVQLIQRCGGHHDAVGGKGAIAIAGGCVGLHAEAGQRHAPLKNRDIEVGIGDLRHGPRERDGILRDPGGDPVDGQEFPERAWRGGGGRGRKKRGDSEGGAG